MDLASSRQTAEGSYVNAEVVGIIQQGPLGLYPHKDAGDF